MKKLSEKQKKRLVKKARSSNRNSRAQQKQAFADLVLRAKPYKSALAKLDRLKDHYVVVCPNKLDLQDNWDELYETIYSARIVATFTRGQLLFNFQELEEVTPPALLYLAAEIFRLRQRYPGRVTGTYPGSPTISAILEELGFFKLLNVKPSHEFAENNAAMAIVKMLSGTGNVGESIAHVQDEIFAHLAIGPQKASDLYGALDEAMTNVSEHAYPERPELFSDLTGPYDPLMRRWWLLGVADKNTKEVWFLLYDQGVTIPVTLPLTVFDRFKIPFSSFLKDRGFSTATDSIHIQLSTAVGRSQTQQSHRGKGIARMKAFVEKTERSELRIVSRYGDYCFSNDGTDCAETFSDLEKAFCGTLVSWNMKLS